MGDGRQGKATTAEFVPPAPDARYYMADERRWVTYAEMLEGIGGEYAPRSEGDLDMLLTALGAYSQRTMRGAARLYAAVLAVEAEGIELPVGRIVREGFEVVVPQLVEEEGRRAAGLHAELGRMVAAGEVTADGVE